MGAWQGFDSPATHKEKPEMIAMYEICPEGLLAMLIHMKRMRNPWFHGIISHVEYGGWILEDGKEVYILTLHWKDR